MAANNRKAIKVERVLVAPVRHPIKAATVLYSAPNFVLRGPIYMIFIIMFGFILYSFWAKKDELVTIKLVLERESVTMESVGGGLVYDLNAKENIPINAGDLVISVQEQVRISKSSEQDSLQSQRFELQRELDKSTDEYIHKITQLEGDLKDLMVKRKTTNSTLKSTLSQLQEQMISAKRTVNRRKEQLNLARKQYKRTKSLYDNRDTTISEFERAGEKVRNTEKSYDDAKTRQSELEIELQKAEGQLSSIEDLQTKQKIERELKQLRARQERDTKRLKGKITSLDRNMEKAKKLVEGVTFQENMTHYRSKNNGLLTNIHVKRGQMITAGTPLFTVIKESAALEARVLIPNKDIGKIKRGQKVKIKYFAYPYQEYGFSYDSGNTGVISSIATRPGGVKGQESMYMVKVALNGETIVKPGGRERILEIGLEGWAEIKTGEKRLIELMFSPVSKFFQNEEE